MQALALGEIFDEARQFFSRESALLIPLGLATFGAAALVFELALPDHPTAAMTASYAPWMLWLIPVVLLMLVGYVAISRLVLQPRTSVGESLRAAVRLLPRAVGVAMAMIGAVTLMAVGASLIGVLIATLAGLGEARAAALGMALLLPLLLWLAIRITLLWPAVAAEVGGIGITITRAFALSRGQVLRLGGLMVLNAFLYILLATVLQTAGGSLLLLVTRAAGMTELGTMLVAVLMAAFNALYLTFWAVLLARIYARLA